MGDNPRSENHGYNIPERGSMNWHEHLNENFESLDTGVEIRDSDSNLEEYIPKAGAKFFATNNGKIYIGDGNQWNRISIPSDDRSLERLSLKPQNGTSDSIAIEPFIDALREGYVVGIAGSYQTVANPEDFSSDAVAIQWANDDLVENLPEAGPSGFVYLPPLRPDRQPLVIDETVVFGSQDTKHGVFPQGWGYTGARGPIIQCEIDDGSPMFRVNRNTEAGSNARGQACVFGGFAAEADGRDATFLHLENTSNFHLANIYARHFNTDSADGVFVIDGRCFNSYINSTDYVQPYMECPDTDVWVIQNKTGDGPPGEIKWGPGNSCYADPKYPFNHGYKQTVNSSAMAWGGRLEGSGNTMMHVPEGRLFLTGYTELGRVEGTNTDHIYFDGYQFANSSAMTIRSNDTGGHDIHIGSDARYVNITPWVGSAPEGGDAIHIPEEPGGGRYMLPYEGTIDGSVTYPDPPWRRAVYPDGWAKRRTGRDTIGANETVRIATHAGDQGTRLKLTNLAIVDEPDGEAQFQTSRGWRNSNQTFYVTETNGVEFELEWEIHRRR